MWTICGNDMAIQDVRLTEISSFPKNHWLLLPDRAVKSGFNLVNLLVDVFFLAEAENITSSECQGVGCSFSERLGMASIAVLSSKFGSMEPLCEAPGKLLPREGLNLQNDAG
jgi:hypothetical protein